MKRLPRKNGWSANYIVSILLFIFLLGGTTFSTVIFAENSTTTNHTTVLSPSVEISQSAKEQRLAGEILIAFGLGLVIAEFFILAGIFAVTGLVAFISGILLLVYAEAISVKLAFAFGLGMAAITAVFLVLAINLAIRSRSRPVVSGREQLVNSIGEITVIGKEQILMRLRGELWEVRSKQPLAAGQKVKVVGIDGLILQVLPVKESSHIDN